MRERALELIYQLHQIVDELTAPLQARHAARLKCQRGCSSCCIDGLSVFSIEAERIKRDHAQLLERGQPHQGTGGCAFLDAQGGCRIYESRPYVCRTQGLPLRWIEEEAPDEFVELRDICPLNADGEPLEALHKDDCWAIGPVEAKLAELERAFGGEQMTRVPLRSLFLQPIGDEEST